jgi:hypothetical protein
VRGSPVLNSHFSPGLAPQVGQRTFKAGTFLVFMGDMMSWVLENKMFNSDHYVLVKTSILADLVQKLFCNSFRKGPSDRFVT